ncbi:phosphotransferase family enzyme [Arcicella aurantiaca]|uniref:Phosphotransferase family enzyme n=1 Tax=Arcicella aurantiaca TaxID=591202 RepID=A0A316EZZ8_9BACT|nr:phosphotransferase [Arcicella aurantiaca]PWK28886.1 phosphotransferase family enzyme [Arcicella aurantiaca]
MVILSKYSVLEYLTWVRTNNYLEKKRDKEFNYLLTNLSNYIVLDVDSGTNNLVFELQESASNCLIFKQFGIDVEEKNKFFLSEITALRQDLDFMPKLHFYDYQNKIIIIEKFVGYEPISLKLRNCKKLGSETIKNILKTLATRLKVIHKKTIIHSQENPQKYPLEKWEEHIKANYPIAPFWKLFENVWNSSQCLVHHDLNGANVLIKDSDVKIIDWEMSEMGHPYLDLCSVIRVICLTMGDSPFFNLELTGNFPQIKDYVEYFLLQYDSKFDFTKREQLKVIFKIHSFYLFDEEYYFKNIDTLLS